MKDLLVIGGLAFLVYKILLEPEPVVANPVMAPTPTTSVPADSTPAGIAVGEPNPSIPFTGGGGGDLYQPGPSGGGFISVTPYYGSWAGFAPIGGLSSGGGQYRDYYPYAPGVVDYGGGADDTPGAQHED